MIVLGEKALLVGDKAADSQACCCGTPCSCPSMPIALLAVISVRDACCAGGPTGFSLFSTLQALDEDGCCYWNFSGGSGNTIDCPGHGGTDAGAGFGFRLTFCDVTKTFRVSQIGALEYCSPDPTALSSDNVCGQDVSDFRLTASNLPCTLHGCCETTCSFVITAFP